MERGQEAGAAAEPTQRQEHTIVRRLINPRTKQLYPQRPGHPYSTLPPLLGTNPTACQDPRRLWQTLPEHDICPETGILPTDRNRQP